MTDRDRGIPEAQTYKEWLRGQRQVKAPWTERSPTAGDPVAIERGVKATIDTIDNISVTNPELALAIANNSEYQVLVPEIAATIRDPQIANLIIEQLFNTESFQPDLISRVTGRISTFADEADKLGFIMPQLPPSGKDTYAMQLAAMTDRGRSQFMSLSMQYLKESPLQSPEDIANFLIWGSENARRISQWERGQLGAFGTLGEFVSLPFRGASGFLTTAWANAVSPDDAWYRDDISIGQNIAISSGVDPSDPRFSTVSATIDGVANFIIDPLDKLAMFAVGLQAARILPRLQHISKGRAALLALPFAGRFTKTAVHVPRGSRGLFGRLGYALAQKDVDKFLDARGIEVLIDFISETSSGARIIEHVPEFKNLAGGMLDQLMRSTDKAEIKDILRYGITKAYGETQPGHVKALDAFEDAHFDLETAVREAELNLIDTLAAGSRFNSELGIWVLDDSGVYVRSYVSGDGLSKLVLREDARVLDVEADWRKIAEWQQSVIGGAIDDIGEVVTKYADAFGYDAVRMGDTMMLTTRGARDVSRLVDEAAGAAAKAPPIKPSKGAPLLDEGSRQSALDTAASVADDIEWDVVEEVTTSGGLKLTIKYGFTKKSSTMTAIAFGENGAIVGARTGSVAGVVKLAERKGVYSALIEGQTRHQSLRRGHFETMAAKGEELSEAAAEAATKAFDSIVPESFTGAAGRAIDKAEAVVDNARKGLDDVSAEWDLAEAHAAVRSSLRDVNELKAAARTAEAAGGARAGAVSRSADINSSRVLHLIDDSDEVGDLTRFGELIFRRDRAAKELTSIERGEATAWIIADMPTSFKKPPKTTWNKGKSPAQNWFRNARRKVGSGTRVPIPEISLTHTATGSRQLRHVLEFIGVLDERIIEGAVDGYLLLRPTERWGYLKDVMVEAANVVDHPIMRNDFIQFFDRRGIRSFGFVGGNEVNRSASHSQIGVRKARPIIPAHLTDKFELPDMLEFRKVVNRYKGAARRGRADHAFGRRWNEGLISGKTRESRRRLVVRYRSWMKREGVDLAGVDNSELMAMAYATVNTPGVQGLDGIGLAAKFAEWPKEFLTRTSRAFSVVQLAGRFIPWFTRVFLDEAIRGAIMNMMSLIRNPFNYASSVSNAYLVSRGQRWAAAEMAWINDAVRSFDSIKTVDEAIAHARTIIRNIDELDGFDEIRTVKQVARLVGRHAGRAVVRQWGSKAEILGPKHRQLRRAAKITKKYDLPDGFTFDENVPELLNNSWGTFTRKQLAGAVATLEWSPGNMAPAAVEEYAAAYRNIVGQNLNDEMFRFAMRRMEALRSGASADRFTGTQLVIRSSWQKMRPIVKDLAQDANVADDILANDVKLAQWYLDNTLTSWVDEVLSPFWQGNEQDSARILREALAGEFRPLLDDVEFTFNFSGGYAGDNGAEMARFADHINIVGGWMPQRISSHMDMNVLADSGNSVLSKFRPSNIIRFWGDRMSQELHRRQAWLVEYGSRKEMAEALGANSRFSAAYAQMKASERVNDIYYNMANATLLQQRLGKVIPFFTAFAEITKTYLYTVPGQMGGMGLGHAALVRKVDRYIDGLVSLGLIEYDEPPKDGTRISPSMRLIADRNRQTGNIVGDTVSHAVATVLDAPLNVVDFLIRAVIDRDESLGIAPDRFEIAISSPLDVTQIGLGSAVDVGLSFTPVVSAGVSWVRNMIPIVASEKRVSVVGTQTLQEIADANDMELGEFITLNYSALKEVMDPETFALMVNEQIDSGSLEVSDIDLRIPNSGLVDTFLDETFFQFGEISTWGELGTAFTPSWFKQVFRGVGLWQYGDPEKGLFGIEMGNVNRTAMASRMISAQRIDEAMYGTQTKMAELRLARKKAMDDIGPEVRIENGNVVAPGVSADKLALVHELNEQVQTMSIAWVDRIQKMAASTMIMQGLYGAVGPSNPRFVMAEETAANEFWATRRFVRELQSMEGYLNWEPPTNATPATIEHSMALTEAFLVDDTNDTARMYLRENYPELLPFIQPKTYWAGVGDPPSQRAIEDYFQRVKDGTQKAYMPEVETQMHLRAQVGTDMQIAIREEYGTSNPYEQAAAILKDRERYDDLIQEFKERYSALDEYDESYNDSAWAKHRLEGDEFSVLMERDQRQRNLIDLSFDMQEMMELGPGATQEELEDIASMMGKFRSGLRDETLEIDGMSQYGNPRERIMNRWYREVLAPYYDGLAPLSDAISEATSEAEREVLWQKVAAYNNSFWRETYTMEENPDVTFPGILDYKWEGQTDAQRRIKLQDWAGRYRPEWLDMQKVDQLLAIAPQLEEWIPSTPMQMEVYDEANVIRDQADAAAIAGQISFSDARKIKALVGDWLESRLIEEGRFQEFERLKMSPFQRLDLAGMLPDALVTYLPMVNAGMGWALVSEKNRPGEDDAASEALWRTLESDMLRNPQIGIELRRIGDEMYDQYTFYDIYRSLFWGDSFGR